MHFVAGGAYAPCVATPLVGSRQHAERTALVGGCRCKQYRCKKTFFAFFNIFYFVNVFYF